MEEHTKKWSIFLRQKQGSNAHPKEKCGCGYSLEREACQRGDLIHSGRTVLPGLSFPLANYLVLFLIADQTQGPHKMHEHLWAKIDSRVKDYGMVSGLIMI